MGHVVGNQTVVSMGDSSLSFADATAMSMSSVSTERNIIYMHHFRLTALRPTYYKVYITFVWECVRAHSHSKQHTGERLYDVVAYG